jgi:hypothetical protein
MATAMLAWLNSAAELRQMIPGSLTKVTVRTINEAAGGVRVESRDVQCQTWRESARHAMQQDADCEFIAPRPAGPITVDRR